MLLRRWPRPSCRRRCRASRRARAWASRRRRAYDRRTWWISLGKREGGTSTGWWSKTSTPEIATKTLPDITLQQRMYRACVWSTLSYALHTTGLGPAQVAQLRGVVATHLRAIARSPRHLTGETSASLHDRLGFPDPTQQLCNEMEGVVDRIRNSQMLVPQCPCRPHVLVVRERLSTKRATTSSPRLGNEFRGLEGALPGQAVHRQKDPSDRKARVVRLDEKRPRAAPAASLATMPARFFFKVCIARSTITRTSGRRLSVRQWS